jgi:hypothetical protein
MSEEVEEEGGIRKAGRQEGRGRLGIWDWRLGGDGEKRTTDARGWTRMKKE